TSTPAGWCWWRPGRWTGTAGPWKKSPRPGGPRDRMEGEGATTRGITMAQDIDAAMQGWEFKPGVVQARLVQADNGRQVIQMRVDLGVLQIETKGRPDGARPHGHATYLEYLRQQKRLASKDKRPFVLSEEQCLEADREFVQFY